MPYNEEYECPYCDEYYYSTQELGQHRDKEHPGQKIYFCQACEKTFEHHYDAVEHVLWDHDVYCDECQRGYIHEVVYVPDATKQKLNEISKKMGALRKERRQILMTVFNGGVGTQ